MEELDNKIEFNIKLLICSLYTLQGYQKNFKNLNVKNNFYFDTNYQKNNFKNIENFDALKKTSNQSSLSQLAFTLISPLITTKQDIIPYYSKNKTLLKKYLNKFKYNYQRNFLCQSGIKVNLPSDKQINLNAIKILFFFAGI